MSWYNSGNWDGLVIHNIVYIMCNVCNGLQKRFDALGGFSGNNPSFIDGDGSSVLYLNPDTWVEIQKTTAMLNRMVSNYNEAVFFALKLKEDFSTDEAYIYYSNNTNVEDPVEWYYEDNYIYDVYDAKTKYLIYSNVTPWIHLKNYINQFKYIISFNSSGSMEVYGCTAETRPSDFDIEPTAYESYCYDNINRLYNGLEVIAHSGEELVYRYYAGGIPDVPRYHTGSITSRLMRAYISYSYGIDISPFYPRWGRYAFVNGYRVYSLSYSHGSIYGSIPIDLYRSYTYFNRSETSGLTISGLSLGLNTDASPSFSGSYSINYNRTSVTNGTGDGCSISKRYLWDCSDYFEGYIS